MSGRIDKNEDENNEDNVPNDYPIPSEYPEKDPGPVEEPNHGPIPGEPLDVPIKEPGRKPKIRVLNVEM